MASPVLELSRAAQIPDPDRRDEYILNDGVLTFVGAACHYFGSWNTEVTQFLENIWPLVPTVPDPAAK